MRVPSVAVAAAIASCLAGTAPCQTLSFGHPQESAGRFSSAPVLNVMSLRTETESPENDSTGSGAETSERHGLMKRVVKRVLEDQKGIYSAPFRPANFKWDILFLAGTGALLATDRRIETHVPHSDFNLYQNISNAALGSMSASLAGVWIYGIKTDHPHAKETGKLELETLTNTFLLYAPMQLIAGRQRPGEGNGKGDFLQHHAFNTSFPAGHAMFTWSMASVVAHEYPKTWVKILAYGAATTVAFSRFRARDHWASDTFVGMTLGYAIGSHVFHSRCDPDLSSSCHR
jgi:membrane-associated phospholipid phosphatase